MINRHEHPLIDGPETQETRAASGAARAAPSDVPSAAPSAAPTSLSPAVPSALADRERALVAWCRAQGSLVIGFSGGVDSAYLAVVALEALGPEHLLAVIGRSASYPEAQWANAREVAARFGVPVLEVNTDELADPRYAANPTNRCYFCKTELWAQLVPVAASRGFRVVADGTNADDLADHRPGAQAAKEREVASPLAALGFSKADIRALSRARGLPTWDQPSSPCLASRLPYGTAVTPERLHQVERAEAALRALGITGDLRVRYFGERARVELHRDELPRWSVEPALSALESAVRTAGFDEVELDPRGFRSGALNVLAGVSGGSQSDGGVHGGVHDGAHDGVDRRRGNT